MFSSRLYRTPAAGGLPLDAYTTNLAGAYSLGRRLLTSYTSNIIEVRRESDNALANIGYDGSNNTDAAAIASHCSGLDDGWARTIYDQSANARHLVQTTGANQVRVRHDTVNQTRNGQINGLLEDAARFYVTSAFTAYTGSTVSGYYVGTVQDNSNCNTISVFNETDDDWNDPDTARLICREGTSTGMSAFRNSSALAEGVLTIGSLGTFFAGGVRFDGTNCNLRLGSNTASEASSSAFNVTRFGVTCIDPTTAAGWTLQEICEFGWWTGDIGDTALNAILTEARTYWNAV